MLNTLWQLAKRTAQAYAADNCSTMAAAISYYVLFSIVPFLIFLAAVFGFVVQNNNIRDEVIDRVVDATPLDETDGRAFVSDTVNGVSRASLALSVVGALGMLWSASTMIGAVRRSLNSVWAVEAHRPVVRHKLIDLALVVGMAALLGASIAGTTALHTLRQVADSGPFAGGAEFFWAVLPLVLPAVLTFLAFLFIYRYLPEAMTEVREVLPGALLATFLFELLTNGYALYVANFNNYDIIYGSLGGIMLFLLWTYLSASILLLGAEFAAQYSRWRRGEFEGGPQGNAAEELRRFLRGLVFRNPEPAKSSRGPDDAEAGPRSS